MIYTAEDFNQFCHQAAGQFLQTVVVIDNEAVFCESPCNFFEQIDSVPTIAEPPTGVLGERVEIATSPEEVGEVHGITLVEPGVPGSLHSERSGEKSKNILKAKPLIDAFADKGVVCSIIRPDPTEENVVERAIAVAAIADIVVVDWALGKKQDETEDQRAREIIKGIIEGDLTRRGRLRLIAIYTAEANPAVIIDELYEHIKGLEYPDAISLDAVNFTIQNQFLKIVILLKTAAGEHIPNIKPVDFDALPEKLQELFAGLNRGLLPSITLQAIAAIREGTHHLLAVLHKDLDSALVGHRCLLPYPDDAEEFCEDLVAGEIRSILALAKIGTEYAGKKQNELWIASRLNGEGVLGYGEFKATPEQISSLLSKGQEGFTPFHSAIKVDWGNRNKRKGKAPSLAIDEVPQFLHGKNDGGKKNNLEFSRLTSFKREAFGLRTPPTDWMPRLTLGTLLQRVHDSKLFLCLQPRCESVRLAKDEKRTFPFLEMEKGERKECIIVNTVSIDRNPEEKRLFFEPKPKNQAIFEFKSILGHAITAEKDNNFYIFSADCNKFYWLGDLKDPFAQHIVAKMSDVIGSVGIDPYEWQRRQGK